MASPQLKLFGPQVTANYHRVAMILHHVGLWDATEKVPLDLLKGEQKAPWFLDLNPWGKIPVLVDGDLVLRESRAIDRYLLEQYASAEEAGELLGRGPRERALVAQWLDFEGQVFHPACSEIGREVYLKKLRGLLPDEALLNESARKLGEILDVYEKVLEKNRSGFLVCDRLTMADLSHAPALYMISGSGYCGLIDSRPRVLEWWGKMRAWPTWQDIERGPSLEKLAAART